MPETRRLAKENGRLHTAPDTMVGWRTLLSAPAMAMAWGILIAGLALTLVGWHLVHDSEVENAAISFQYRTERVLYAIGTRMAAYEQLMRNGVALFSASEEVTRNEWRIYVESVEVQQHFPGIQGLGVSRWIPAAERDAFVDRVRAEGYANFDIHPSGEREAYTAIAYIEPFDWRNQRAFGFDMYSEPVRREAMERARDTGEPALSRRVILLQETDQDRQAGSLMYLPIYRDGRQPPTVAERRAALVGWIYSPFRMNDLMQGIFGPDLPDIRMEIHEDPSMTPETLMYDSERTSRSSLSNDTPPAPASLEAKPRFARTTTLTVAGNDWHIRLSSLPEFDQLIDRAKLNLVLASGSASSILLFLIVATLIRNRLQTAANNQQLRYALAERETLLREVHHRVKNNLQSLWGLLQIERAHMTDPNLRIRLEEIGQRINVMGSIHQQLYQSPSLSRIDLKEYLTRLCHDLTALHGNPQQVTVTVDVEPLTCGLDTAIPLGLIANELVSNSLKHAFPDERSGNIQVSLHRTPSDTVELVVGDDGIGMGRTGMGEQGGASGAKETGSIGLMLVRSLGGQVDGTVTFDSLPGTNRGSVARVTIPRNHFTD